jgi:hypothetical protein
MKEVNKMNEYFDLKLHLNNFFVAIQNDPRINPIHISLFMAILHYWNGNQCKNPISVFSRDLMQLAKISGTATYHRSIRELDEYGYIKYVPSYNHFLGSLIYLSKHE